MSTHTTRPTTPIAAGETVPPQVAPGRRPELDWLRTLIVLGIIPYHALSLFVTGGAGIVAHTVSAPLAPLVYTTVDMWGISLIFLLAGAASRFALDTRSPRAYVAERVLRLGVPALLVALLIAPLQAYIILLNNPRLATAGPSPLDYPEQLRNIGAFFVRYWTHLLTTGTPIIVRNPLAHLWFVPRLLIISLICLPLFLLVRRKWAHWAERIPLSRRSTDLLVLAAGLVPAAAFTLLAPGWLHHLTEFFPLSDDWTLVSLDLIMFVYGYLLYTEPRLLQAVRRLPLPSLGAALVLWAVILPIKLLGFEPAADYSPQYVFFTLAQTCAVWLLSLAALGLALRYLTRAPSWQRYLAAAAFPVYVLHLPLLIVTANCVQDLPLPWFGQLALVIVVTVAGVFAFYEFVVRRTPLTRFLFGRASPRGARPPKSLA